MRRVASIAAASALGSLAMASSALAGPTVTLKYLCTYPLVDEQPLSITISSDIPSTVPAGTATNTFHINAVSTAGGDTRTGLKLVKAASVEGNAYSTAAFSGPEANLTVNVPIPVTKTTINPSDTGDLVIAAAGSTPPITLRKQGTSTITLKTIRLNLIARKADGTAITGLSGAQTIPATDNDPNTFDVSCRLDPAAGTQNAVIGTVKVTAPTDATAPTAPGKPVISGAYTSTVNLSWAASTDAKGVVGYDVYDGDVRVASTTGATSVSATYLGGSQVHSLTVRARDAAGNVSAASPAATATTTTETAPTGTPSSTPLPPVTLTYACTYPLIGAQTLSVKVSTNIPTSAYAGSTLPKFNIITQATVPVATYDALGLVGAKTIEGSAEASSSVRAPGFTLPLTVPVNVTKTTVPATRGPITLNATGTTPAIKFPKPGNAKIAVDALDLNLTARRADGTVIVLPSIGTDSDGNANTFDVHCTLSPVTQTGLLGTIALLKDTILPTVPGKPTVSAITKSTATVAFTGSTDNAAVASYDVTYNGTTKTVTSLSTGLTGLTANTTYSVTVKARDASGNVSAASAATTFKTLAS